MQRNLQENSDKYATSKRLEGMLQVISEEVPDVPLYYTVDGLSRVVHTGSPPVELLRSALLNAGYRVSFSHANKGSLKTDAPTTFVWDMFRKWVEAHPINLNKHNDENNPGRKILSKKASADINFELHADAEPLSKEKNLVRFQLNPEANWGPKPRPLDATLDTQRIQKAKKRKAEHEEVTAWRLIVSKALNTFNMIISRLIKSYKTFMSLHFHFD
jgi:tRNA (guanine26-N2/guanine27-N2)-dimethyltransferase